jgi:hypothetical protein
MLACAVTIAKADEKEREAQNLSPSGELIVICQRNVRFPPKADIYSLLQKYSAVPTPVRPSLVSSRRRASVRARSASGNSSLLPKRGAASGSA